jgi:hypothetical protein
LGQSPHDMMQFDINVSIVDLVSKVVLFDNPGREKCKCDSHILVPVKGGKKVKKNDVKAHELGIGCAEHAMPM